MSSNGTYKQLTPKVNPGAEFIEIVNDFSDPLELLREAISNAIDWGATFIKFKFFVDDFEGEKSLIIEIDDNGSGMTEQAATEDFWGLGFSNSRGDESKIGHKGHGTKIYLRSKHVELRTQSEEGAYEVICERPLASLSKHKVHSPKYRKIEKFIEGTGTVIKIVGYNNNERSRFTQAILKDYLLWFTKHGSFEQELGIDTLKDFKVHLQGLDAKEYEEVPFGHIFPEENSDSEILLDEYGPAAADYFVKKYKKMGNLKNHPEVTFEAVIYVEGDHVKREYNSQLRQRVHKDYGTYRVSDRYGLWLCKDYIPIQRVNDWILSFGSGSNAFVLLHGFINCQDLKLTANRGNISNSDPLILEELKDAVKEFIDEVDDDLKNRSLYVLREWLQEERTKSQEEADFKSRVKRIKKRAEAEYKGLRLVEPQSESEVFGLFITIRTLNPELFDFEPLDYNTSRGIDIIAKNLRRTRIAEGEYGYVELKNVLYKSFNHGFDFLKWIVCWDFHKDIEPEIIFTDITEQERKIVFSENDEGDPIYFLEGQGAHYRIQVIRLKELIKNKLGIEFIRKQN